MDPLAEQRNPEEEYPSNETENVDSTQPMLYGYELRSCVLRNCVLQDCIMFDCVAQQSMPSEEDMSNEKETAETNKSDVLESVSEQSKPSEEDLSNETESIGTNKSDSLESVFDRSKSSEEDLSKETQSIETNKSDSLESVSEQSKPMEDTPSNEKETAETNKSGVLESVSEQSKSIEDTPSNEINETEETKKSDLEIVSEQSKQREENVLNETETVETNKLDPLESVSEQCKPTEDTTSNEQGTVERNKFGVLEPVPEQSEPSEDDLSNEKETVETNKLNVRRRQSKRRKGIPSNRTESGEKEESGNSSRCQGPSVPQNRFPLTQSRTDLSIIHRQLMQCMIDSPGGLKRILGDYFQNSSEVTVKNPQKPYIPRVPGKLKQIMLSDMEKRVDKIFFRSYIHLNLIEDALTSFACAAVLFQDDAGDVERGAVYSMQADEAMKKLGFGTKITLLNPYMRTAGDGKPTIRVEDTKSIIFHPRLTDKTKCRYCSTPKAELRCTRCKRAYYCNQDCQSADWNTLKHKTVCDYLKKV